MRGLLPTLGDDADLGVQKDHVVVRDGKADLAFTGTLLALGGAGGRQQGKMQEYRIYETTAGKHVFSRVGRSIFVEDEDTHEAEVFDPAPSSGAVEAAAKRARFDSLPAVVLDRCGSRLLWL